MTRSPIVLTSGDPSGIGPEIAVKAWQTLGDELPFFLLGDIRHLPAGSQFVQIDEPAQALTAIKNGLPVLNHEFAELAPAGKPVPDNAQSVIDVISKAVQMVTDGHASALCTNPIHKKALKDGAAFQYPGHTEFLAALAGVDRVAMMLACDALRVVPVTIHISLADVPTSLTPELLRDTIRIVHASLIRDFGIPNPQLAIAGLNPHAGEGGAMGHEEIDVITPVLDELRGEGLNLSGPSSADTMFHAGARKHYDVAICMYHDQALIPIKTLDFDGGVNVTLGLPFVRTSPDHGTAYDIAGQGVANPSSLIAALRMANKMAMARL